VRLPCSTSAKNHPVIVVQKRVLNTAERDEGLSLLVGVETLGPPRYHLQ
jgi:hypothetical protein